MKRLFENELDLLIDIDGLCVCWEKPNKIENRSQLRIASFREHANQKNNKTLNKKLLRRVLLLQNV